MKQRATHFPGLDGMRGVAALVVVFLHGTIFIDHVPYTPEAACLAVDFFFLLSGFVLAHAYDARLTRSMTWHQFMTLRIIRLYPMLLVGTAMGGSLFILSQAQKHEFGTLLALLIAIGSFTLLPVGFLAGTIAYPVNIAVWSLFFEFAVNALYGSRFGRLGQRRLVLLVAVAGLAMIPMAIWGGPYIQIGFGTPVTFLLAFVRVTYPFWAGVLLCRSIDFEAMPRMPIAVVGATLAVLLLVPVDGPAYKLGLVLVVFPAIVAVAASATPGNWAALACSWLGRLSYPVYLINVPIFRLFNRMADWLHLGASPWLLILAGSVVSLIVAETLAMAFDVPVRRWLLRRQLGFRTASL